jgi:hypothetical protein
MSAAKPDECPRCKRPGRRSGTNTVVCDYEDCETLVWYESNRGLPPEANRP